MIKVIVTHCLADNSPVVPTAYDGRKINYENARERSAAAANITYKTEVAQRSHSRAAAVFANSRMSLAQYNYLHKGVSINAPFK